MKIKKNTLIVGSIVGMVILFIIFYAMVVFGSGKQDKPLQESIVPTLENEKETYKSKLEAVDAIKEEKKKWIPEMYDESKLDENGYFIDNKEEKDKQKIIDSIYKAGKIQYSLPAKKPVRHQKTNIKTPKKLPSPVLKEPIEDIKKEQEAFFKANSEPTEKSTTTLGKTDPVIYAEVNGNQVIKNNNRLEMRLAKDATINGFLFKKNTYVYGNTKFKPNRIIVTIKSIDNKPVALEAYDVQDGGLGIYVENSLRAETGSELSRDLSSEINEPIPGISTLKKIFRRKTKNIKVTVINKYQLLLKPKP